MIQMTQIRKRRYRSFLRQLHYTKVETQVRHRAQVLYHTLPNYPLQRLIERMPGQAIDRARVATLEERAARMVLAELNSLTQIAAAHPDQAELPALFGCVLPVLAQALVFQDGEWSVRRAAVRALGAIWGDNQIVPMLVYLLNDDKTAIVARAAAEELAAIADEDAIAALTHVLGNKNEIVREVAVATLGHKNNRRLAIPALERALRHPYPNVRHKAANILRNIDRLPQDQEMAGWYAVAEQRWDIAGTLLDAAIPALENAIRGKHSRVRLLAAQVLDLIGWKPPAHALRASYLVAKQRWTEATAMRFMAGPAITQALEGDDASVRQSAANSLESMGMDAVYALVDVIQENRDQTIVEHACAILARIAATARNRPQLRSVSLFTPAIAALSGVVCDRRRNISTGATDALAEIADSLPDDVDISDLFADALDIMRESMRGQHHVVRQNLQANQSRIKAAIKSRRGNTPIRPDPTAPIPRNLK